MMRTLVVMMSASLLSAACAIRASSPGPSERPDQARNTVFATERAFAATMAERDFDAFTRFLSEEAIFFGGKEALRGKAAVAADWQRYYEASEAPFSWAPESVEVLDSGALALSSGPVHDALGQCIGTFTSIWRLESDGHWRIVFDKGSSACPE